MAKNDTSGCLFSAEEMTRILPNSLDFTEDKPVTVLGITFENDAKRREYFREELRKKLPELRNIEGFPIGSDDDIINLSDPPYYTACPNPWLNDFIEQWEEEKNELLKQGKRQEEFDVKEPYADDITDIKNDSVYRSLFYHTKVPQAIIMRYIMHYTQPGDIVFDGFAGTGMTGLASQTCENPPAEIKEKILSSASCEKELKWGRRHAICIDLSSFACAISHNLNTPCNVDVVKAETERIYKELLDEYGWMYKTRHTNGQLGEINSVISTDIISCTNCGTHLNFWNSVVDKNEGILKDDFYCPNCGSLNTLKGAQSTKCTVYDSSISETLIRKETEIVRIAYTYDGKRFEKAVDDYDRSIIEKIENLNFQEWYPNFRMPEGGETRRNDKDGITHTHHFYTKRNLIILAAFLSKINKSMIPHKLRFLFTGMIMRSSILNKVHFTKYLAGRTDWDAGYLKGTLYVPPFSVESSALAQIQNKLTRYVKAIPSLPLIYDNCVMNGSSCETTIADNSIDYIFVDPPFGANIMYSELNFLPESWLKVFTNNRTEAIQDNASGKGLHEYSSLMHNCFREFYRILKPGKWMTVEFSNTSASVWNSIQQSLSKAGFIISNVASLNKGQGGMRAVTTTTAVKQDLAITCYKPSEKVTKTIQKNESSSLWELVEEHLNHIIPFQQKNGCTYFVSERDPRIIYDRIVSFYVQNSLSIPISSLEFQKELRERYIERDGMFFTAVQAAEYDEKKKLAPEFVPMGIIVSDEANGIQWLKNQLQSGAKTYQEIQPEWMQAINGTRKNDIIPELKQLLEENFIEDAGGKWRLPNIQDDKDVVALRTKALLREFKLYVETANKPKGKIKEARVEALRTGFKQCYIDKDFQTIVTVGDKIPQNLLTEDEVLLQFYDIAQNKL